MKRHILLMSILTIPITTQVIAELTNQELDDKIELYHSYTVNQTENRLDTAEKQYSASVSALSAMTNIPSIAHKENNFTGGIGLGGYNSEFGFAVGAEYHSKNAVFKGSIGAAQTELIYGAGWSWIFK